MNVLKMLDLILLEDEDVIQIYDHKIICERLQDVIHHPNEICWSISQAKRHDQPHKNTLYRLEGNVPYIGFLNRYLVVARLQINLTKKLGSLKFAKNIINPWNWILIHGCEFV